MMITRSKASIKWSPLIDSIFYPFEIKQGLREVIADYCEESYESNKNFQDKLIEFKIKMLEDEDNKVDIDRVYYHNKINRIVYELSNGVTLYVDSRPLIVEKDDNIQSLKDMFNETINKK